MNTRQRLVSGRLANKPVYSLSTLRQVGLHHSGYLFEPLFALCRVLERDVRRSAEASKKEPAAESTSGLDVLDESGDMVAH